MLLQWQFFIADYKRMCGAKKSRYLYLWLSRQVAGAFIYRFERGMYLTFGRAWRVLRVPLLPVLNLIYFYSNCEIHYLADIGPGISILHSSLGNVVSGNSFIGNNLTLTGGNVIGIKGESKQKRIVIGHNLEMGVNAVIIGPVIIGHQVTVGASACVVKNAEDNAVLVGVPAKNIHRPVFTMYAGYHPEAASINYTMPIELPVTQSR